MQVASVDVVTAGFLACGGIDIGAVGESTGEGDVAVMTGLACLTVGLPAFDGDPEASGLGACVTRRELELGDGSGARWPLRRACVDGAMGGDDIGHADGVCGGCEKIDVARGDDNPAARFACRLVLPGLVSDPPCDDNGTARSSVLADNAGEVAPCFDVDPDLSATTFARRQSECCEDPAAGLFAGDVGGDDSCPYEVRHVVVPCVGALELNPGSVGWVFAATSGRRARRFFARIGERAVAVVSAGVWLASERSLSSAPMMSSRVWW